MNLLDWIVLGLLALGVFAALRWICRQHRRGKHVCCGECTRCGDCSHCSGETER